MTAAVVLAAGASRRMGTNKMLLTIDGETLVRRAALRAVEAALAPVVVVVGHEHDQVAAALAGLAAETVINSEFTGPTSGSLHRGLERLPATVDSAVVLLADMVHVTAPMIVALRTAGVDAPLAVSRYGDVLAPPLFFRRALFPELLAWHGEGCGRQVVLRHRAEAVYLDWPVACLADVDTPEDYAALAQ